MKHPDVFGSVYALHPVGTGTGVQTMYSRMNWDLLAHAKSMDDLKGDNFLMIFTAIFQAHLPNPDKPPLYIDLPAHKEGNNIIVKFRTHGKAVKHILIAGIGSRICRQPEIIARI